MTLLHILILAIVQGAAELLPVSSSAHVIVAERLLGIDPGAPEATLILVLLHTGTMLAVILYFRKAWQAAYGTARPGRGRDLGRLALATALTGMVGYGLKILIERTWLRGQPGAQIEALFGNLTLVAGALCAAGLLILAAGLGPWSRPGSRTGSRSGERSEPRSGPRPVADRDAAWIGLVQGLCLPFRGFSRSGATISTALIRGVDRGRAEEFSFALAVLLTPPVLAREISRLVHARALAPAGPGLGGLVLAGGFGLVCSFLAGLLALKWLSRWLERGRWHWFGIYCLAASALVMGLRLGRFR